MESIKVSSLKRCVKKAKPLFPKPEALLRLAGAVLVEQHEEWAAADRRYFSERSMTLVTTTTTQTEGQVTPPELMTA